MTASQYDIDDIVSRTSADFNAGRAIDLIAGPYRVHIDRQLPYLVIYRNPSRGISHTGRLFRALSSYVELPAGSDHQIHNQALVDGIVELQANAFGCCLLVEIWTTAQTSVASDAGEPLAPHFTIVAREDKVPTNTLHTLEEALQSIRIRKQNALINISYQSNIAPPGEDSLFNSAAMSEKASVFGLNIDENFQSSELQVLYPFALRNMQKGIVTAIKKMAHAFSHEKTLYKPGHYHEIGRQAMDDVILHCDKALAEISEQFDLLLYVTPVNASRAWLQFSENEFDQAPEFHYRPRNVNPALLKQQLFQVPIEEIEDPALYAMFASKRDELDEQIGLLNKRETPQFLFSCIQMFGTIDETLRSAVNTIFSQTPVVESRQDRLLAAGELEAKATIMINDYQSIDKALNARVEVREDITGILVSHGNFLIGTDAQVSESRLQATLAHEIGTHALTYHNGKQQTFHQLFSGMAGYEELQEGLAVFSEFLCGGLGNDRLLILAGRVVAVDSIIKGADFIETFRLLRDEYRFYPHTAFYITMRVYRGGGYTKDIIYLRGIIRLIKLISEGVDLELLYTGKMAFEHVELIEELMWRKIVHKPSLLPQYLSQPDSLKRLEKIKQIPTLQTLIEMGQQ